MAVAWLYVERMHLLTVHGQRFRAGGNIATNGSGGMSAGLGGSVGGSGALAESGSGLLLKARADSLKARSFYGIPTNVVTLCPVSVSDTLPFATVTPEPWTRFLFAEVSQGMSMHGGEPET